MSWFVKNALNYVYPCISKIWTVFKLKLLITCPEFNLAYSRIESANFKLWGEISGTIIFLRVKFLGRIICISNRRSFTGLFFWTNRGDYTEFSRFTEWLGELSVLQYEWKFRIETCLVRMRIQRTQYWWRLPHTFGLSEVWN